MFCPDFLLYYCVHILFCEYEPSFTTPIVQYPLANGFFKNKVKEQVNKQTKRARATDHLRARPPFLVEFSRSINGSC